MLQFIRAERWVLAGCAILVVCLAALCTVLGGNHYWNAPAKQHAELLLVANSLSPAQLLPLEYSARIAQVPGVAATTELSSVAVWLPTVQRPNGAIILDKTAAFAALGDLGTTQQARARWLAGKNAVLLSAELMRRLEVRPGQSLAAKLAPNGPFVATSFTVAGSFKGEGGLACDSCILLGRDFVDAALPSYRGVANAFLVSARAPSASSKLANAIDREFENEAISTRTGDFSTDAGTYLRQLIDLRRVAWLALASILLACALVPAVMGTLLALRHRASYALLQALGRSRAALVRWLYLMSFGLGTVLAALAAVTMLALSRWVLPGDALLLQVQDPGRGAMAAMLSAWCVALAMALAAHHVLRRVDVAALFEATGGA